MIYASFSLAKLTFATHKERFELIHEFSLHKCCYKCCKNVKMNEHNAPRVSTESSKKEIGRSAQGQGEEVLFFLGFEAANEPATIRKLPWTYGEHFIYNFKICKKKGEKNRFQDNR